MSGWNRRWLWRSMSVTSTSAFFSRLATCSPPKPPPTITTRRRCGPLPSADTGRLRLRLRCPQSLEQVITDPQPVGHRRKRGVHGADAREEARVDDVQVVELVSAAVPVEDRRPGIVTKSARSGLMCDARHGDLVLEVRVVGQKVSVVHTEVGQHRLELVVQPLLGLLV